MRLKAAECRYFLMVLHCLLENLWEKASPHAVLRLQCVTCMVNCYFEINNWDELRSPARLGQECRKRLLLFSEVKTSVGMHNRWDFIPKHHLWQHLCESSFTNPKFEWVYLDEDDIGKAARLARGVNQQHFHTAFMERYRAGFRWDPTP